jgi:hypothetical protein
LDQLAHQGALSDVLPKTKTRPHIEEAQTRWKYT